VRLGTNRLKSPVFFLLRLQTKFLRPNGFKTFLVHNLKDLEVLLMHNKTYAAEIAHNGTSF